MLLCCMLITFEIMKICNIQWLEYVTMNSIEPALQLLMITDNIIRTFANVYDKCHLHEQKNMHPLCMMNNKYSLANFIRNFYKIVHNRLY